ncbi:hypothetical protein JX265_007180 [Neoarthrinium moseri]|uniref:Cerato-ulmin n=1 Tax=Neoarthrinium moseri TaxID=1658444 RepID=A0A9P9WKP9_9PEZI|nr:uncharacterized protein JN550_010078 [Neoarthrinium moseri]KAI1862741.1 hypothetical protein JN550_010078 [Neoarthrinium moseri]KAI1868357.1 hypothetical protein JX265_007180 [Neoarthrinium moseri]
MQFSTITVALFSTIAIAAPSGLDERQATTYMPCRNGLYTNPQCCATDVSGIADLDCANPPLTPVDPNNFSAICALIGQRARCCALTILDIGVLCETPQGVLE